LKKRLAALAVSLLCFSSLFSYWLYTSDRLSVIAVAGFQETNPENNDLSAAEPEKELDTAQKETIEQSLPEEEPFQEYDITLMAVGDNLMHMGIVNTGKQEDGTYDYSVLFQGIRSLLDISDIKIINQETILGGNELGFSGYPRFNSPTQAGDAIAEAGFNVVLHASNHSADQNIEGINHCAAFWNTHPEVLVTGIYGENGNTSDNIPLLTVKDVTFAVLNYTYGPNAETLPRGLEDHLNLLCAWNENSRALDFTTLNPQVLEDISRARELADVVIVCPHWGAEYATAPSSYQKTFALQMAEAGADVIIGTHPHVVQPVEWIEAENGNRTLCYYSLGNYLSTQKQAVCMLEALAWITFHVTEDEVFITDKNTGVIPMVCQYSSGPLRFEKVYFLEDYTETEALAHGIRNYGGVALRIEDLEKWSSEILGDWILPVSQILNTDYQG